MVWAGVTHDFKTPLHIIQGTLTSVRYVDQIIEPHVLLFVQRNQGVLLQQDNARPHVARHILNFLRALNSKPMSWPAKCSVLYRTVNVWDSLDRYSQKRLMKSRNLAELRQALIDEWQRLPVYKLLRLLSTMRRCCQACVAAGGGHTRY